MHFARRRFLHRCNAIRALPCRYPVSDHRICRSGRAFSSRARAANANAPAPLGCASLSKITKRSMEKAMRLVAKLCAASVAYTMLSLCVGVATANPWSLGKNKLPRLSSKPHNVSIEQLHLTNRFNLAASVTAVSAGVRAHRGYPSGQKAGHQSRASSANLAACRPDFCATTTGLATWRQAPGRQGLRVERDVDADICDLCGSVVVPDIRTRRNRCCNQHRTCDTGTGQF
jgi:hypothetical protein